MEYFYQFFDRAVVDPLLGLTWDEYTARYALDGGRAAYTLAKAEVGGYATELLEGDARWADAGRIIAFALDEPELPENPSPELLRSFMKWTLRRTMRHSSPQFWFLAEVVYEVPGVGDRCPSVWPDDWEEEGILVAAAADAFLERRIRQRTLWTVCELMGLPWEWLELTDSELARLDGALQGLPPGHAPFPWQSPGDCRDGEYVCLGLADTRRFLRFLEDACQGDWPAPRLKPEYRRSLSIKRRSVPRVSGFELPGLLDSCGGPGMEKAFVVRYCA